MRNNFTVKIDNTTFHYNDIGKSDIPLVFIHGFPFDRTMWYEQQDALSNDYRVITFDIRGFGNSVNDSDTRLSIDVFAEDLLRFLEALKIEKAIVCGLSMGGYILMNAYKKDPSKFAALILCDTQCNADTAEAKEKRLKTIEKIRQEGTTGFAEDFVKSVFHESSFTAKKEKVEQVKHIILQTAQQTIIASLKALAARNETCSMLPDITVPTLIICGKQDKLTPPEKSEAMHKAIANSKYVSIDMAGHLSNIEQPETFNGHVREFIKSL